MISKRMYKLLSELPRDYSEIPYKELILKSSLTKDEYIQCKVANQFLSVSNENYFYTSGKIKPEDETIGLTDHGLAEIEQYEQQMETQKATEKSILLARLTLYCAIATLFATIALH